MLILRSRFWDPTSRVVLLINSWWAPLCLIISCPNLKADLCLCFLYFLAFIIIVCGGGVVGGCTECPNACGRRCSQTQYHKPCMFFCQKCCRKCLCVPPGFYGNKQVCACYNNWKTKRGGPKCP